MHKPVFIIRYRNVFSEKMQAVQVIIVTQTIIADGEFTGEEISMLHLWNSERLVEKKALCEEEN